MSVEALEAELFGPSPSVAARRPSPSVADEVASRPSAWAPPTATERLGPPALASEQPVADLPDPVPVGGPAEWAALAVLPEPGASPVPAPRRRRRRGRRRVVAVVVGAVLLAGLVGAVAVARPLDDGPASDRARVRGARVVAPTVAPTAPSVPAVEAPSPPAVEAPSPPVDEAPAVAPSAAAVIGTTSPS